ncbi:MAG: CHRD domain-containing protein [Planctomycetota bacterium]|nr:CHRD domain-containing protein [Planctomycetota bacterium]
MSLRHRILTILIVGTTHCAWAPTAPAQTVEFLARIDSAQEVPPNTSPARGIGVFAVDTVTDVVSYRILFSGLSAAETVAHIHGFAPPGVNAGVLNALALGSPKCGTWNYAATQEPGILAGTTYVNIHSTAFPGGEIRGQIAETPIHGSFCHGDGSSVACPCGNNSALGDAEGCLHSGGMGGRLRGYGQASIANDRVVVHALRLPPTTQGLLFQGSGPQPAALFGDGQRCVAGPIVRLGVKTACNGQIVWPEPGDPSLSIAGSVLPSTVPTYQVWYRNPAAFCTASTFNLTNAIRVAWAP